MESSTGHGQAHRQRATPSTQFISYVADAEDEAVEAALAYVDQLELMRIHEAHDLLERTGILLAPRPTPCFFSLKMPCRVTGCREPVPDTHYYRYARICYTHADAPRLTINGAKVRWCWLCKRFQPLADFDGTSRSCRASMDRHNAARRVNRAARRVNRAAHRAARRAAQRVDQRDAQPSPAQPPASESNGSTPRACSDPDAAFDHPSLLDDPSTGAFWQDTEVDERAPAVAERAPAVASPAPSPAGIEDDDFLFNLAFAASTRKTP